jgi:hypothetical protein
MILSARFGAGNVVLGLERRFCRQGLAGLSNGEQLSQTANVFRKDTGDVSEFLDKPIWDCTDDE